MPKRLQTIAQVRRPLLRLLHVRKRLKNCFTISVEHDDWCSCDQCVNGDIDDIVEHLPRETRAAYYARKEKERQERGAALLSKDVTISTKNGDQINAAVPEVSTDDATGGACNTEERENHSEHEKRSLAVSTIQVLPLTHFLLFSLW